MSRQESDDREAGQYKSRLREMTSVLHKYEITKGLTPEKLRIFLAATANRLEILSGRGQKI